VKNFLSSSPLGPPLVRPVAGESAELLNARVRARNDRIVGDVVDASVERSAELREQRERREAERRAEYERIERRDAEALAERTRGEAEAAERREDDPWRATLLRERADRIEARANDGVDAFA